MNRRGGVSTYVLMDRYELPFPLLIFGRRRSLYLVVFLLGHGISSRTDALIGNTIINAKEEFIKLENAAREVGLESTKIK